MRWRNQSRPAPRGSDPQGIRRVAEDLHRAHHVDQDAGGAFIKGSRNNQDLDRIRAGHHRRAMRDIPASRSGSTDTRFHDLQGIHRPTLVVNGIYDRSIPISDSYRLAENLPTPSTTRPGPDTFFQFHDSFSRHTHISHVGHVFFRVLTHGGPWE